MTERPTLPSRWWLLFLAVALVETVGSLVVRARVVPSEDWPSAIARVRTEWQEGDALVSAPSWTDPLLREAAGELLDVQSAGLGGLEGRRRLWSLSIRGHRSPDAPSSPPELRVLVGRVLVERWTLPPDTLAYDFVGHAGDARFSRGPADAPIECHRSGGRGTGGGLGAGPVPIDGRASCGGGWAGETVIEDLEFRARHCILLPPSGRDPVRATWQDVPLGDTFVAHGGLHWVDERHGVIHDEHEGTPVSMVVRAGDAELLRITHVDGQGWMRWEREVPEALRGTHATVTFETTTERATGRSFCFTAVTLERGATEVAAR